MTTPFETLLQFESFYDALHPAQKKDEEAFLWLSGLRNPIFNAIMHIRNHDIDSLISKIPQNLPFSLWIHNQNNNKDLPNILSKKGFQPLMTCPLMTWDVSPIDLLEASILPADLGIFHSLLASVFHFDESIKKGFASFLQNARGEHYVIYANDTPIGTGSLMLNGKIGAIFNLAILPLYQKQGFGKAILTFLMHRAHLMHMEKLILLSSPQAESFYSTYGFKNCLDITLYAPLIIF